MNNEERSKTDLITHPGEELEEMLVALGMTQDQLAIRTGLSRKHINSIIRGKEIVSPKVAMLLERVIGTPASYWVNLSKNYEFDVIKKQADASLIRDINQLSRFPIREMVKLGWLIKGATKKEYVSQILSFFGVADFSTLNNVWDRSFATAYRRGKKKKTWMEALAVWLRKGQMDALGAKLGPYNEEKLRSNLSSLRTATKDVKQFPVEAAKFLGEAGVSLVTIPHLSKTYVNGAAHWVQNRRRPVVQISLRNKFCDIIIFTLFHELAHILLHSTKNSFIEYEEKIGTEDEKEKEADRFAQNLLIPEAAYAKFIKKYPIHDPRGVETFAAEQGIHPCIVVGRMQRENIIPYPDNRFHRFKLRYDWAVN